MNYSSNSNSNSNNVIENNNNNNVGKGISIANRRVGFDASSLHPCGLQTCTDFFTVPPGISPSELLASPVMLPNAQAQSSPTTGRCCFSPNHESSSSRLNNGSMANFECGNKALEEYSEYLQDTRIAKSEECKNRWEVECLQQQQQPNCKINSRNCNNKLLMVHQEQKQQQQKCWEDGFLWRKYGQKQVKGSEFPRSYYKCTSSNCDVTKKVERSLDGQISEIVYKGSHNHPKINNNNNNNEMINIDAAATDDDVGLPLCEKDESPPPPIVFDHHSPNPHVISPHSTSNEEDDHTSADPKRRKIRESLGAGLSHEASATATARSGQEPKIVLQIKSETDILEDGYRWRKYGQKVVKGNPNPRSYYKCTTPDCLVRKHVERAADDIKSVVITYEGKHNHEVPSSRTSSTSVVMSVDNITPLTNPTLSTPSTMSVVNRVQDQLPLYMQERKPILNYNEFMTSNLATTFGPPIYPYSFSTNSHSLPTYSSNPFIMNSNIPMNNYQMVNLDCMSMSLPSQTNHVPVSSSNVSLDPNFHFNNYVPPMQSPSGQCQQIKEEHENYENKSRI